ncbi:MAG: hypothetical protein AMXMBFR31_08850 [Candidatus Desulfobacillus denitrificans]
MPELTESEIAELAKRLHGYAEMENLRPAFRALCDFTAAILDEALAGEVSPEFAGDAVDLWAEVAEREHGNEGVH